MLNLYAGISVTIAVIVRMAIAMIVAAVTITMIAGMIARVRAIHVVRTFVCDGEDFVLAKVATETEMCTGNTKAGNGQHTNKERPASERHLLPQAAHLHDVLFVVAAFYDLTGAKEQHRLEERVRDQVEQRRRPRANAHAEDHVAQLAQC